VKTSGENGPGPREKTGEVSPSYRYLLKSRSKAKRGDSTLKNDARQLLGPRQKVGYPTKKRPTVVEVGA